MGADSEKIAKAAAATDQVLKHWWEAQERLRICFTNGAGVLSDPSNARADLKAVIAEAQAALKAMEGIEWPSSNDYGD